MKYIVLSFDDGRKDFYTYALPILKKYKLKAVLNVISNFVENDDDHSRNQMNVSWSDLEVCMKSGIEIAQGGVARQLRDLGDRALGIDKEGRGDIHAALGEQTVEGIMIIFVDETV